MLLHGHRVVRAALHRRVVGDAHALVAADAADAGDDPGAARIVVHPECGEWRELEERGPRIEKALDALARQELPGLGVPFPRALRTALARLGEAFAQLRDQRLHRVAVGSRLI